MTEEELENRVQYALMLIERDERRVASFEKNLRDGTGSPKNREAWAEALRRYEELSEAPGFDDEMPESGESVGLDSRTQRQEQPKVQKDMSEPGTSPQPQNVKRYEWELAFLRSNVPSRLRATGLVMAHHCTWDDGTGITVGQTALANEAGTSRSHAFEYVRELLTLGWVALVKERPGRTNVYRLSLPSGVSPYGDR